MSGRGKERILGNKGHLYLYNKELGERGWEGRIGRLGYLGEFREVPKCDPSKNYKMSKEEYLGLPWWLR